MRVTIIGLMDKLGLAFHPHVQDRCQFEHFCPVHAPRVAEVEGQHSDWGGCSCDEFRDDWHALHFLAAYRSVRSKKRW